MRISDWSSVVCSSDLRPADPDVDDLDAEAFGRARDGVANGGHDVVSPFREDVLEGALGDDLLHSGGHDVAEAVLEGEFVPHGLEKETGRASGRERVGR